MDHHPPVQPPDGHGSAAESATTRRALIASAARGSLLLLAGGVLLGAREAGGISAPAVSSAFATTAWLEPIDARSLASFQRHASQIARVSPTWFSMYDSLTIKGRIGAAIRRVAAGSGVALHPLIKNANFDTQVMAGILAHPQHRATAAQTIAELVLREDFAGINLDFEGPFGRYQQHYVDLVAQIVDRLRPHGKPVTVNVVPRLKPVGPWAAPYDYEALGAIADAVFLMAYDYAIYSPGPIAPLWWVSEALDAARAQIPAARLVIGLSFYGRHWIVKHGSSSVYAVTQSQAEALRTYSGAAVERPDGDATPRFSWSDAQGMHVVHYEDGQSLIAKLQRALTAGVAGFSFWRLGQEKSTQWDVIGRAVQPQAGDAPRPVASPSP